MSYIKFFNRITSWKRVLNAARRTIGKEPLDKEPSESWKAKILLAEHSPIRLLEFDWGWSKIKQFVTAHLVRHHEGCEKFVHSQRGDRRGLLEEYGVSSRDELPQGAENDMDMTANAQAMINISRKRLCKGCASPETREAWTQVIEELRKDDPVLASKCVPDCIYRGFCAEWMSDCKYSHTLSYKKALAKYRNTDFGEIIWKEIKDGLSINQHGTMRDDATGEEIKLSYDEKMGYLYYYDEEADLVFYPHFEVAKLFLDNYDPMGFIVHLDGNRVNNHKDNLKVVCYGKVR